MRTQIKHYISTDDIKPVWIARADAARLLGNVHISTLTRLEDAGLLIPRRLNPRSPTGHCFYSTDNVDALINGTIEEWLIENAPQQLVQEKPKLIEKATKVVDPTQEIEGSVMREKRHVTEADFCRWELYPPTRGMKWHEKWAVCKQNEHLLSQYEMNFIASMREKRYWDYDLVSNKQLDLLDKIYDCLVFKKGCHYRA